DTGHRDPSTGLAYGHSTARQRHDRDDQELGDRGRIRRGRRSLRRTSRSQLGRTANPSGTRRRCHRIPGHHHPRRATPRRARTEGGNRAMSSVLYDTPGPRARRRTLVGSLVIGTVLLGVITLAVVQLIRRGQFTAQQWGPLLNPDFDTFRPVWHTLAGGMAN